MDKEKFITLISALGKGFRVAVDQATIEIYYEFLNDIKEEELKKAIKKILEQNKYFPTIAEIRQTVVKSKTKELNLDAEDEWEEVRQAIRKFDIYDSENALLSLKPITRRVLGMTCSWYELCTRPTSETQWIKKDFISIFNREIGKLEKIEMLKEKDNYEIEFKNLLLEEHYE